MRRPPPRSTLFPYTTLFRSHRRLWRKSPQSGADRARAPRGHAGGGRRAVRGGAAYQPRGAAPPRTARSEEHTSELQSRRDLVCRLLLEKKKNITIFFTYSNY